MSARPPALPAIVDDPDEPRRTARMIALNRASDAREFPKRLDGMIHAMDGGLWLHRHLWKRRRLVHLVSTDRDRLIAYGVLLGMPEERLQFKPLRDPRTRERRDAWHWDLGGPVYPPHDPVLIHIGAARPPVSPSGNGRELF